LPGWSCTTAFFQPWLAAADRTAALRLLLHLDDVDPAHFDLEELLDGLLDLRLVRVGCTLKV
jgi:hypothetical protein